MKKMDAPMHRAEGDGEPDAHTPNDAACCERSTPKRPEGREKRKKDGVYSPAFSHDNTTTEKT